MPSVLITAFEPYDRWSENSSWLALVELTRALPEQPKVVTRRYPVDFQAARQRLQEDLAADYDVALHLGQSPGCGRIQLEAIGLNIGGHSGQTAEQFQPLEPHGPAAYRSDLPLASWVEKLRGAGIPSTVSYHAGTYLCNALLYLSLHLSQSTGKKTRSAFVHLPLAPEQVIGERNDFATLPTAMAAQAVGLILAAIQDEMR